MSCANIPNAPRRSSDEFKASRDVKSSHDVGKPSRDVGKASQMDDVKGRLEKTTLMKKVFNDAKPDPATTFAAFVDFDFFSQIRQPWRKCKDAVDINFIV